MLPEHELDLVLSRQQEWRLRADADRAARPATNARSPRAALADGLRSLAERVDDAPRAAGRVRVAS